MRECFSSSTRKPYLVTKIQSSQTLDDVRGKVSIVSRNPYGNSSGNYRDVVYGAIIEGWPDDGVVTNYGCNMTISGNTVDCHANVEDVYNSDVESKQTLVKSQLELAEKNRTKGRYNYTFTSIANSPAEYAQTMNPATAAIIEKLTGPLGYVYGDYMGSPSNGGCQLLRAIVSHNMKYVFKGRSRVRE